MIVTEFQQFVETIRFVSVYFCMRPFNLLNLHAENWSNIFEKWNQKNLGGDLSVAMHPHFRKGPFFHVINWSKIALNYWIYPKTYKFDRKWANLSQNPSNLLIFMSSTGTGADSFISDHLLKVFKCSLDGMRRTKVQLKPNFNQFITWTQGPFPLAETFSQDLNGHESVKNFTKI